MRAHRSNIRLGPRRRCRGSTSTRVANGGGSGGYGPSAWSDILRAGLSSQISGGLPWAGSPNCELRIDNCQLGRGDPPWLAVQHREVDVGHEARRGLIQSGRYPDPDQRSGEPARRTCTNGAGGRTWETVLRMTESPGIGPPIGYDRARESISHVRADCSCRSEQLTTHRSRLRMIGSTTRSFASDAEHEFPRIRSAGLFPMKSFRRSGYPPLLLMQLTLFRRREVDDTQTSKAFS